MSRKLRVRGESCSFIQELLSSLNIHWTLITRHNKIRDIVDRIKYNVLIN